MREWLENNLSDEGYGMFFGIGMFSFILMVCLALITLALK